MKKRLSRAEQMARIRARNTRPEKLLRSYLWSRGFRYRLHVKALPGRPDLVFPGIKTVIFIDGCFWHGCPDHYVRPRSRPDFWAQKLAANVERDRRQACDLAALGWRVLRLWEHAICGGAWDVLAQLEAMLRDDTMVPAPSWRVLVARPEDPAGTRETRTLVTLEAVKRIRTQHHRRHTRKWPTPAIPAYLSLEGGARTRRRREDP